MNSRSKNKATIRFYEELNDFLESKKRKRRFEFDFRLSPAVKDVIESFGVPHTEVDLILVNGQSVGFERKIENGDDISVYPVFESFDLSGVQRLRPAQLRIVKFVLDVHLGKLAKLLRVCGFDARYENNFNDKEIIEISLGEKRTILTRDLGLLKNSVVTHGYFVRNIKAPDQLREIIERFHLNKSIEPFTRCTLCNAKLERVDKTSIAGQIPPKVKNHFDEFRLCIQCGKIYWRGSHYDKLKQIIDGLNRSGSKNI